MLGWLHIWYNVGYLGGSPASSLQMAWLWGRNELVIPLLLGFGGKGVV